MLDSQLMFPLLYLAFLLAGCDSNIARKDTCGCSFIIIVFVHGIWITRNQSVFDNVKPIPTHDNQVDQTRPILVPWLGRLKNGYRSPHLLSLLSYCLLLCIQYCSASFFFFIYLFFWSLGNTETVFLSLLRPFHGHVILFGALSLSD